MDETRYVDESGGEKGQKPARFGGADPKALMELALVYGYGEQEKYSRYNYLKGYPWSLSVDALFRHLFAFLDGEDRDPESGLLHTAHAAWHCLTLTSYQIRNVGTDDRAPQESAPTVTPSLTDPIMSLDEIRRLQMLEGLKRIAEQLGISLTPQTAYPDDFGPLPGGCGHSGEKYTSVAGTTNCAKCFKVLDRPSSEPW